MNLKPGATLPPPKLMAIDTQSQPLQDITIII